MDIFSQLFRRHDKGTEEIMEKQEKGFHGSDIEKIEKIYGIKKEEIINFSANVNPLGIPPLLLETLSANMDAIAAYPDREYTALRKEIAAYAGTDYRNVAVGNGSTELISLFIRTAKPKKSLVLAPTYSEYEREITLEGGMCRYYALQEENGAFYERAHARFRPCYFMQSQ